MPSDESAIVRANWAVSTVATLTMLAPVLGLLVLVASPGGPAKQPLRISATLALGLVGSAAVCWLAVRYRLLWFIVVPIVVTLVLATMPEAKTATWVGAFAILITSVTLLVRRDYLDGVQGHLSAAFLAACSGWSSAIALLLALFVRRGVAGAWIAPLLPAVVAIALGVWASVARLQGPTAVGRVHKHALFSGFFTCFGVFLAILLGAVVVSLPHAGANSGSAAPGAWQPRP